jgi:hypothetical protein
MVAPAKLTIATGHPTNTPHTNDVQHSSFEPRFKGALVQLQSSAGLAHNWAKMRKMATNPDYVWLSY